MSRWENLRGDKFVVEFADGSTEVFKHTDIQTVLSSIENLDLVISIFEI